MLFGSSSTCVGGFSGTHANKNFQPYDFAVDCEQNYPLITPLQIQVVIARE